MKYWVLNRYEDMVYVLDERYDVYDFSIQDINLLSDFVHIIGYLAKDTVEPAIWLHDDSSWVTYPYVLFSNNEIQTMWVEKLLEKGYIVSNKPLNIYSANLLLSRRIRGLLSESGGLLRLELTKDDDVDLDSITNRMIGCVVGYGFCISFTDKITVAKSATMRQTFGLIGVKVRVKWGVDMGDYVEWIENTTHATVSWDEDCY